MRFLKEFFGNRGAAITGRPSMPSRPGNSVNSVRRHRVALPLLSPLGKVGKRGAAMRETGERSREPNGGLPCTDFLPSGASGALLLKLHFSMDRVPLSWYS